MRPIHAAKHGLATLKRLAKAMLPLEVKAAESGAIGMVAVVVYADGFTTTLHRQFQADKTGTREERRMIRLRVADAAANTLKSHVRLHGLESPERQGQLTRH